MYLLSHDHTAKKSNEASETKSVTARKSESSYEHVAPPTATKVTTVPVAVAPVAPTPSLDLSELQQQLETLEMGVSVLHKKFGIGTIERLNKSEKFVYVKFSEGEKKFIFPDAFVSGYLILP